MVDLARDGMVDLDVPDDGIDVEVWVDEYLADGVDHELLYDPALDGIDDNATDHQYGFGRMDYEGMFAVFNTHNDAFTGAPHPLASLRMTAGEWDDEQRLQRAVTTASVAVARAAIAGTARTHLTDDGVDVELVAHRTGSATCWAGNKDDRHDAYTLADVARTDARRLTPLHPDTAQTTVLHNAVRARSDLIATRVALCSQLRAHLRVVFPAAVGRFADLDSPISLTFLTFFPSAGKAAWLSHRRLGAWLAANRSLVHIVVGHAGSGHR